MRHLAVLPLALCLAAVNPIAQPPNAMAQQGPAATGVPAGPGGADPMLFRAPPIDPTTFILSYNRMTGTTPDFRPVAEQSTAVRNASAFDRADFVTREIARLEGLFASFDPHRTYSLRLATNLRQYDAARQGYPTGLDPEAFIPMQDPVNHRPFGLQFRNLDDIAFLPMGNVTAARNFAQRHRLSTQYDIAGEAVLELAYRLVEAPPAIGADRTIVRGDILAARLVTRSGQPIWEFGPTAASRSAPQPAQVPGSVPVLKAADVQGIRIGMPRAEASGITSRDYPLNDPTERLGGSGRWFRGAQMQGVRVPMCGLDAGLTGNGTYSAAMAILTGEGNGRAVVADESEACLGFDIGSPMKPAETVTRVTSGQRLAGQTPDAVRQALIGKYGPPTYTREGGKVLQWIGRDPARPDGGAVAIVAQIEPRQGGGVVLAVESAVYVDPRPRQGPSPTTPTAPRL